MADPLADFNFSSSDGLFVSFKSGEPVKLRVLTKDPLVSIDKFGNTRFAFVVWNYNLGKAQILNRGASIAKELQALHLDEDFGANIQKIDVKITATGEGKETRYSVQGLQNSANLKSDALEEAKQIDLPAVIKNGIRMSELNKGEKLPEVETESEKTVVTDAEPVIEDINDDEEINLDDIPF